jgi:hypothetical protein
LAGVVRQLVSSDGQERWQLAGGMVRLLPELGVQLHLTCRGMRAGAVRERRWSVLVPLSAPLPPAPAVWTQLPPPPPPPPATAAAAAPPAAAAAALTRDFLFVVARHRPGDAVAQLLLLLDRFHRECAQRGEPVYLLLLLPACPSPSAPLRICPPALRSAAVAARRLCAQYASPQLVQLLPLPASLPDSAALDEAVTLVGGNAALLWLAHTAVHFSAGALRRARLLLRSAGVQVLMPRAFQLFPSASATSAAQDVVVSSNIGRFLTDDGAVVALRAALWRAHQLARTGRVRHSVRRSVRHLRTMTYPEPGIIFVWRGKARVCAHLPLAQCAALLEHPTDLARRLYLRQQSHPAA